MFAIINGPNLNLLGRRQPEIYGYQTFEDYFDSLRKKSQLPLVHFQSNSEGAIVSAIQRYGFDPQIKGIIINPGAYAHYSIAIADAIRAVPATVIEVHISNIHAREPFRHQSVTGEAAKAIITGCGLDGYRLALSHLRYLDSLKNPTQAQ